MRPKTKPADSPRTLLVGFTPGRDAAIALTLIGSAALGLLTGCDTDPTSPTSPSPGSVAADVGVATTAWQVGDVFAAVGQGTYKVFANDGTFKETISSGSLGQHTGGCAFNPDRTLLYTTEIEEDRIVVYSVAEPHDVTAEIDVSEHGMIAPRSVAFARNGDFFVGNQNYTFGRYSPANTFQSSYDVAGELAGWIDLAADQRTLYYTSFGIVGVSDSHVLRYDVSTGTQLSDFASFSAFTHSPYVLRLLPPGDGSGGLLVAAQFNIWRLDADGNMVKGYNIDPPQSNWSSLALDPNGTSFWGGDHVNGHIYRFNIATGDVELGPIESESDDLFGLCVLGEPVAGLGPVSGTEEINDLAEDVLDLGLAPSTSTSLQAKLNSALAALDAGNTAEACASLQAFINALNAQAGKKKVSTADAAALIETANAIRTQLGC